MNLDFNPILKVFIPYSLVVLFAYVLVVLFSMFLPKTGVDFISSSKASLTYKKYDGFYSKAFLQANINNVIDKNDLEILSKFELTGIYSTLSNSGWASISKKGSSSSTILKQYEKFNGYKLIKLFKKHIVLEKNLIKYKLELPKEKYINYTMQRKNSDISENIIVNENGININRKYLNSYVNDIEKVWNNIAINSVKKSGLILGFKINEIKRGSIFEKLGLKKGDIIKSINSNELKSYADAFKIYNEINKLSFLKIDVERDNKMVELNYEIN